MTAVRILWTERHKVYDLGAKFKVDITEMINNLDSGEFCTESGCEGQRLEHISDEEHRILMKNPTPFYWEKIVQGKYNCPCCGKLHERPPPPTPFQKVDPGTEIIVRCAIGKVLMGLPIHRQSKWLEWLEQSVSLRTIDRLFHALADKLRPLYADMRLKVSNCPVMFTNGHNP